MMTTAEAGADSRQATEDALLTVRDLRVSFPARAGVPRAPKS